MSHHEMIAYDVKRSDWCHFSQICAQSNGKCKKTAARIVACCRVLSDRASSEVKIVRLTYVGRCCCCDQECRSYAKLEIVAALKNDSSRTCPGSDTGSDRRTLAAA